MSTTDPTAVLRETLEEVESRLCELLCDLTGGRLSKANYPVAAMAQEIEEHLGKYYESDATAERDALAAAVERVRALHYPADNDWCRSPRCPECLGKAGVHECGCWADVDRQPVCGVCNEGHKGVAVPWPCPTIRALDGEATA